MPHRPIEAAEIAIPATESDHKIQKALTMTNIRPEAHKEPGCSARAIDHSTKTLGLARERNAAAIADGRLALHEAEAECLPFADDEFTAAAMTNVFFFLYRPDVVLAEIQRTLAPGGRVAIHTDATGFMAPPPIARRMRFYTDDELRDLLEQAGYAEITVRRTGPGERMQLATARKPDPANQPT